MNDKSHLKYTRDKYDAFMIETEEDYVSEEQGYDLMYNDEYDDTYDSHNVGAADDATDEQFIVKRSIIIIMIIIIMIMIMIIMV